MLTFNLCVFFIGLHWQKCACRPLSKYPLKLDHHYLLFHSSHLIVAEAVNRTLVTPTLVSFTSNSHAIKAWEEKTKALYNDWCQKNRENAHRLNKIKRDIYMSVHNDSANLKIHRTSLQIRFTNKVKIHGLCQIICILNQHQSRLLWRCCKWMILCWCFFQTDDLTLKTVKQKLSQIAHVLGAYLQPSSWPWSCSQHSQGIHCKTHTQHAHPQLRYTDYKHLSQIQTCPHTLK